MKLVSQISVVLLVCFASFNASAYEGRCEMMGQTALASYTEVLVAIGKNSKEALMTKVNDAQSFLGYYEKLGCQMKPLYTAIECFNRLATEKDKKNSPIATIARTCMQEAGFN